MDQAEVYLTARDVMARYHFKESTLYRHIRTGYIIAPVKIGGMNRWRLADLVAWEKALHDGVGRPMQAPVEDWIEDELKEQAG